MFIKKRNNRNILFIKLACQIKVSKLKYYKTYFLGKRKKIKTACFERA